jgi:hypothetical protein
MKTVLLFAITLSAAIGCTTSAPSASPSSEPAVAPSGDRVFVEATLVELSSPDAAAKLRTVATEGVEGLIAKEGVGAIASAHVLVRVEVPTHLAIPKEWSEPPPTVLDVLAHVLDGERVRLQVALALEGGAPMETTLVVGDKQSVVLGSPEQEGAKHQAVVLRSTIIRSDADLEALLAEKTAARARATARD